jgi:hypothetical protein
MKVEKNRQLSKPAKRKASLSRKNSKDQLTDMKAKLVASISELHLEHQRFELSSLLRKWKLGNFLFALKSLVGHGNFEREFESLFGDTLSFRQAQRYMQAARTIAILMPVLRARLRELRPDLTHDELTDEEVLKELNQAELVLLLDQKRPATAGLLSDSSARTLSPQFAKCLQLIASHFDCVFLTEATELTPIQVDTTRVGANPVEGISEWPKTISERSVWRLCSEKKIPAPLHVGGAARWTKAEIEQWFHDARQKRDQDQQPQFPEMETE